MYVTESNGLMFIGLIWATVMAILIICLFCVINKLPSDVQIKKKHGQVYPEVEISTTGGKDAENSSEDEEISIIHRNPEFLSFTDIFVLIFLRCIKKGPCIRKIGIV